MILIVCIQGNLENFKGNFFPNKKYVTIGVIQVKVKSFVKNPKHKIYDTMYLYIKSWIRKTNNSSSLQ